MEERWKSATKTLLLVNSLIATVAFAAIFTLPGGYDEGSTGLARFRSKPLLQIFVLFDALAMFSAMLSALINIIGNFADYKGLSPFVLLAFGTTHLSLCFMCKAFYLSLVLTMKPYWALQMVVVFLDVTMTFPLLIFLAFAWPSSTYYACWRVHALFRKICMKIRAPSRSSNYLKLS